MNGAGFECDACHKRVIIPGDPYIYPNPRPPVGWFAVYGPILEGAAGLDVAGAAVDRHELCSFECLAIWASIMGSES